MSVTKRNLEGDRSIIGGRMSPEEVGAIIDAHTFRLPGRRRNSKSKYPLWDPFYANYLAQAEKQLGIVGINVNGAMRYTTASDRDAVKALTERLWAEALLAFEKRLAKG